MSPFTEHLHTRALMDAYCDGTSLAKAMMRKALERVRGTQEKFRPAASYNGLLVYDSPELNGGGKRFRRLYSRVLLRMGWKRCNRIFEFCAGPGYIGYSLLAHGFSESLTLADINLRAVLAARHTAKHNGIEDRVTVYESDCLDGIPPSEKWDLVVGIPPNFSPLDDRDDLMLLDRGWALHRRFYAGIKPFMTAGGLVILVEHEEASNPGIFAPMIEAGGGKVGAVIVECDLTGDSEGVYFMVGHW